MLSCLTRLTASSSRSISARVFCRTVTETAAQPTETQATDNLEPYPLPDVYVGKMKGVQVDFQQRPAEGEALLDKIRALPAAGAYVFDYQHLKDELDQMDEGTRMCFQMKYLAKDRQTFFLTKYLQDALRKTQNPLDLVANEMEFKIAKYALHHKNLQVHMARFPRDRKTKTRMMPKNAGSLLAAQKVLMKVNFARYDYLMNELRMDPPLDIWRRGPHHSLDKPRDPERTLRFIRKHRLRAIRKLEAAEEAKQEKISAERRKRFIEEAAALAADGILQHEGKPMEIDHRSLPKNTKTAVLEEALREFQDKPSRDE
ncbi:uncharacterized protein LOC135814971 [Sycon ciliatum]|uniref:uncharacterized protein LOC135814971 n=1 Tax=Sycon ciliatum TaxID=27933 RepID=UPI0020AEB503|eukprot:scpid88710/ scgid17925/ 